MSDLPVKIEEFWETPQNKPPQISRSKIIDVAGAFGFCLYQGELYRIIGKEVHPTTERQFSDTLKEYIKTSRPDDTRLLDIYEAFLQKSGKQTIIRLPELQRNALVSDNETTCYKFYKNAFLEITAGKVTSRMYTEIPENKYILATKKVNRDYIYNDEGGAYLDFLMKATRWGDYEHNIKSIIGYLCHEYKDETTGYIIILTEVCLDPKDGGGSGKNLFCNLLSHSTSYHSKNGSQVKFDEKFFQSWNGQRIMGISDVQKNFNYEFLKEPATGTFILKKLFKDEVEIPVEDGPKFIVQTNYSYDAIDGGLLRRIRPIEFTDFFTKEGGVDSHYGYHFPKGWTKADWNNYDTIIADSISLWLSSGRKLSVAKLSEDGWRKQFETNYNGLIEWIEANFGDWVNKIAITSKDINDSLKSFYIENSMDLNFKPGPKKIASALKEYSKHFRVECKTGVVIYDKKCYTFKSNPF